MGMTVNFTGAKTNPNVTTNKKSTKTATYIGAGLGTGWAVRNLVKNRAIVTNVIDNMVLQGVPKGMAKGSAAAGAAMSMALLGTVGALVGKGVGKIINHFRKSDDAAEKPDKEPPTIKVKGESEFKVEPGHPKKVYKKDPETGEWEFQTAVYDGSWGKESSDKELVTNLTKKVY